MNKRYVYNGWMSARQSKDNALASAYKRPTPCELIPFDWMENDASFCLNPISCQLDHVIPKGAFCFNFTTGFRTYIYVNVKYLKGRIPYKKPAVVTKQPTTNDPTDMDKIQLDCIRQVANFASSPRTFKFDAPGYDPSGILEASPKAQALIQNIKDLDAADFKKQKCHFKHFIFTDVRSSAKPLTGAIMHELGIGMAYDKNHRIVGSKLDESVALLYSGTVYGKPLTVKLKKEILSLYNSRTKPDNIHGQHIRFIVLDNGFKEGIDLFDVKYVHVFEPPLNPSDRKQVIGRTTRTCGQSGLPFNASQGGWPLSVFVYDVGIPNIVKDRKNILVNTLNELLVSDSSALDTFTDALEKLVQKSAVDAKYTEAVHSFVGGGLDSDKWTWPRAKLENGCIENTVKNKKESKEGTFTFNPTQEFVRDYLTPTSKINGLLLYHSTGTGKTCTAIATASASFENAGYTVLWVTRSSLKADMKKNMVNCRTSDGENKNDKAWRIPTMSYRQFTNLLQGKNDTYRLLLNRPGITKKDTLAKVILIIDEAHKLLMQDDLKAAERPDMGTLDRMIHNSYAVSGTDAVKVILMTATPTPTSPMDMIKLINLLKPTSDILSDDFETFSEMHLTKRGSFTKQGERRFSKWIGPHVSYLNREKDARQFAQPRLQMVESPMSTRKYKIELPIDLKTMLEYKKLKTRKNIEYIEKAKDAEYATKAEKRDAIRLSKETVKTMMTNLTAETKASKAAFEADDSQERALKERCGI